MTILGYPRPPKSGNQEIPWYRNGRSDFFSAFFSSSAFQAPRAAVPTLLGSLMTSSGHLDAGGRHTDPPGGEILSQKSGLPFLYQGISWDSGFWDSLKLRKVQLLQNLVQLWEILNHRLIIARSALSVR